jgi:hypothetical protein
MGIEYAGFLNGGFAQMKLTWTIPE